MRCYEPELPVADFNIDGAPAEGTGEKEGAHGFPHRKSYRKRKSRLGQEFLDLNIRQLETVRGSRCEDDGPIRYADNVAQGTRKLDIAVGDDGHSIVTSLRSVVERIAQKLELIVHDLRCRNFGIIRRGATCNSFAQDSNFLERNEIGLVGLNLLGDGFRTLLWFEVVTGVDEKLCNRLRGVHPLP